MQKNAAFAAFFCNSMIVDQPIIILTALPDKASADILADGLVRERLAACVNIFPQIESIYFWEGKLVRDNEVKLFIKTTSRVADAARSLIKAKHPYSVPEITTIGEKGDVAMQDDYWRWLTDYIRK